MRGLGVRGASTAGLIGPETFPWLERRWVLVITANPLFLELDLLRSLGERQAWELFLQTLPMSTGRVSFGSHISVTYKSAVQSASEGGQYTVRYPHRCFWHTGLYAQVFGDHLCIWTLRDVPSGQEGP